MSDEYPKYFYKYRSITNTDNLKKDYAIEALLNNQAVLSSRTNFNDIFDSTIELIRPSPKQIKELRNSVGKSDKAHINTLIDKGRFTAKGLTLIENLEEQFSKLIDSYAFFSVSDNPTNNLMWAHYANSHKGFCIEFKSEFLKAEKVTYADCLSKLNTIDMFRLYFKINNGEKLGQDIWQSLRTKLNEWSYESEYRFQLSNAEAKIPPDKNFIKHLYSSEFIESIIFGYRMPIEFKEFIAQRIPSHIKLKQAVAKNNSIEVTNSNLRAGL